LSVTEDISIVQEMQGKTNYDVKSETFSLIVLCFH